MGHLKSKYGYSDGYYKYHKVILSNPGLVKAYLSQMEVLSPSDFSKLKSDSPSHFKSISSSKGFSWSEGHEECSYLTKCVSKEFIDHLKIFNWNKNFIKVCEVFDDCYTIQEEDFVPEDSIISKSSSKSLFCCGILNFFKK